MDTPDPVGRAIRVRGGGPVSEYRLKFSELLMESEVGLFGSELPTIIVGEADRHDLLVLAMGGSGHDADTADDLLFELGRARVVPDSAIPSKVIRMGSEIVYSFDNGPVVRARLAFSPQEGAGGISILSPVGTALLGLAEGQTMRWTTREGRHHVVRVHRVKNPAEIALLTAQ